MYQILQKFDIHWHDGGPSIAMMCHLRRVSDLLYNWKSCLLCYMKDVVLHCSIFFKWNKLVRVRVREFEQWRHTGLAGNIPSYPGWHMAVEAYWFGWKYPILPRVAHGSGGILVWLEISHGLPIPQHVIVGNQNATDTAMRYCTRSSCPSFTRTAHYTNVIMGAIASQITSLTIVYSTVYSDADQRKHQSSTSLAFVRGIHRSPHKWPVTWKMLPFDDVVMTIFQHDNARPHVVRICWEFLETKTYICLIDHHNPRICLQ